MNQTYNLTDYEALQEAIKTFADRYQEMHNNMNEQQQRIEQMTSSRVFKGDAAAKFTAVFNDIKAEIDKRREALNSLAEGGLQGWISEMSQAESSIGDQASKLSD